MHINRLANVQIEEAENVRKLDSLQIPFEKGTTNLSSLLSRLLAIQRREDHFARVVDQIQRDDDPPAPRVQGGQS